MQEKLLSVNVIFIHVGIKNVTVGCLKDLRVSVSVFIARVGLLMPLSLLKFMNCALLWQLNQFTVPSKQLGSVPNVIVVP